MSRHSLQPASAVRSLSPLGRDAPETQAACSRARAATKSTQNEYLIRNYILGQTPRHTTQTTNKEGWPPAIPQKSRFLPDLHNQSRFRPHETPVRRSTTCAEGPPSHLRGEEEDRDGTPSRRKKRIPSPSACEGDGILLSIKKAATYSPAGWAVPSARPGLTSLCGMGRGGTPEL